ncbi:MAG: hypothetical protein KDA80_08705, partial [Planctomycetaceae bacterium]|nr:hypothetical protein [Planctomycetaceae bacterium]
MLSRLCVKMASVVSMLLAIPAFAQFNNNGNNNNGNNNQGFAGILIDSEGIIETRVLRSGSSALLKRQQEQYVHDNLPEDLVIESPERVLSLRSVEA